MLSFPARHGVPGPLHANCRPAAAPVRRVRSCRRQRGLKQRLLPSPAGDPEVIPSGIDDSEIRQAPGPILEILLKRPPCRHHQFAFTGDIVNLEHELNTCGWQPRREGVRNGPPRCPHPYHATLHRYVRVRVMALILCHSKAQYPSVKVDGRIKVGRKDLTPQCHLHLRIVAQPALSASAADRDGRRFTGNARLCRRPGRPVAERKRAFMPLIVGGCSVPAGCVRMPS